ncbi:MAG: hypothetical protein NVS3B20_13470 [Polyangiales bacterium]
MLASATLATLGATSVFAWVRTSDYRIDPDRLKKLRVLTAWQLAVVDALVSRMCAADVPYDAPAAPPKPSEVGASAFVDAYLAAADEPMRKQCRALFGLIEHAYPLSCGERHRFTKLSEAAQDRVLTALEHSSIDVLRGAFHAAKSLMMMAYYRDPRTWGILGYDGPLEARPDEGWVPPRYLPMHLPVHPPDHPPPVPSPVHPPLKEEP